MEKLPNPQDKATRLPVALRRAVEKIEQDPDLRVFVRHVLIEAGIGTTPVGPNAHLTSYALGRHSLGMDIITLLDEVQPKLYPVLLLENVMGAGLQEEDDE